MFEGMTRTDVETELGFALNELDYLNGRVTDVIAEIDAMNNFLAPKKQRVKTARKATRTVTRSRVVKRSTKRTTR